MKTGFHDRVTLCSNCGVPLQASRAGTVVRCDKCQAENLVSARVDDAVSEGWSEDELARFAHLKQQDRSYRPDPSIATFVAGMRLSRPRAPAAFAAWQALRQQPGRENALTDLTLLLAWRAAEEGDPHRERGLLESALAAVRTPPHQNRLRAALSVLAARMGDLDGAESWLATTDARAADLHSDSACRFARAYLDTARGRFSRVLLGLGGNDVDVPIADELAGPCALLRANAWERLHRPATALELLLHYKFEGDPFGQQLARSFGACSRHLDLCPTAEPEAERQRLLTLGRRRIRWTTGMVVVLGMGLYFLVSAIFMFLLGLVLVIAFPLEGGFSYVFFGFLLLFPALLFLALLRPALRRTKNERALLARGAIAPARCLPGAQIGGESPGTVLVESTVWVAPDHEPPFELRITLQTNREHMTEFIAGRPFTVRHFANDILIEPHVR